MTRNRSMVPVATTLLAFLMAGAVAPVMAQTPMPAPGKMAPHEHMKGMPGMSGMMEGPHHALAMAYGGSLVAFARALEGQVTHSTTVNLDLARPAVAEMRRSFDQMQQHHQAQMTMMGDQPKPAMAGAMQHMETHATALSEHLTALEAEVNTNTPDPKKVSEHTREILKHCAGMSGMPAKAKPHPMK